MFRTHCTPSLRTKALRVTGIPIIAVYGDADIDLPPEENVLLLQERFKALGGHITVIAKPGVGHHPHSLADPTPISSFIFSHVSS
jgi:pimeloyl-ACP methyl ester carboxylesterase